MAAIKGKVLRCKGLQNKDFMGKSDPYVKVTLRDQAKKTLGEMQTATKNDELDPEWEDENFSFSLGSAKNLEGSILFKVMDSDWGPDTELGEADVPVALIPISGDAPAEYTFSLGMKSTTT